MAAQAAASTASGRQWYIVGRWQEYEGEGRVNLLRVLALVAFYLVQLVDYHFFQERTDANRVFHQTATAVVAGWSLLALAIHVALRRQYFPAGLKYVAVLIDLMLLTSLLLAGGGPASPLVFAYFPLIVLAGLRFSLPLVRCAALGAMACYLGLVGAKDPTWFDANHVVPLVEQAVVLLSLGLTGIIVGQIVRRVRGMAEDYARRLRAAGDRPA